MIIKQFIILPLYTQDFNKKIWLQLNNINLTKSKKIHQLNILIGPPKLFNETQQISIAKRVWNVKNNGEIQVISPPRTI